MAKRTTKSAARTTSAMKTTKKKLTRAEEFEILKLVLDKFLWTGVIIMLYGLYRMISGATFGTGLWIMFGGAVLLVLLMVLLVREYEVFA